MLSPAGRQGYRAIRYKFPRFARARFYTGRSLGRLYVSIAGPVPFKKLKKINTFRDAN